MMFLQLLICILMGIRVLSSVIPGDTNRVAQTCPSIDTCTARELSHSILIECAESSCRDSSGNLDAVYPKEFNEVVHISSTRSGDRFVVNSLQALSEEYSGKLKLFDINATLHILDDGDTRQSIVGFGTSIELEKIGQKYGYRQSDLVPIFRDLFAKNTVGNQLTFLRLVVKKNSAHKIQPLLEILQSIVTDALGNGLGDGKIKVIIELKSFDEIVKVLENFFSTSNVFEYWLATDEANVTLVSNNHKTLLVSIDRASSVDAWTKMPESFDGLLMKQHKKEGYSHLLAMTNSRQEGTESGKVLISVGDRHEINLHGDWQNAQQCASEILNNLRYGSNGYIDRTLMVDVLSEPEAYDAPIYSLRQSHDKHFRGPLYYAMGHFSRFVVPGSRRVQFDISSSPNMFAAHYLAFITPQNYITVIVLNDNEHLLPFRVAIDGKVLARVSLQPKSFNTLIVNRRH